MKREKKKIGNEVPNTRAERTRKPKKKMNSGAVTLVILLVIAIIFLLGPTLIKTVTGTMTSTDILKTGIIEDSFNTKAIIIREEEQVISEITGTCISTYQEGEKVPRKATVATVIDSASQDQLNQIKSLNVRISQAKDDIMNNKDFVNEELKTVDEEILRNAVAFSDMHSEGSFANYSQIKKNIDILLDQKKDLKSSDSATSSYLEQLTVQREKVENTIKGKMKNVLNENPGVVSYVLDGFETEYTPQILGNVSVAGFEKMVSDINSGSKKAPDNAYVKIVTGLDYYLVCSVESSNVTGMKKGDLLDIRINDKNMIINVEIDSISIDGKDAVVVFKSGKALSKITSLRLVDIDVISKYVNGIRVPRKALMNVNNIEYTGRIAIIRSGYVYYADVKILAMNAEYAIIENLNAEADVTVKLNDFIVIDPTKVSEGQIV